MGGINCKLPKGKENKVNPSLVKEYTRKLAKYSGTLFDGISSFYMANTQIERAIMGDGSLDQALGFLEQSEQAFGDAQSQLGTVSALWGMITPDNYDFTAQLENIGLAAEVISRAQTELAQVSEMESLQKAIWDRPTVTDFLVAAVSAINTTMAWQTQFATRFAAVTYLV